MNPSTRPHIFHSESYRTISAGLNHNSHHYSFTARYLVLEEIGRLKSIKQWLSSRTRHQWLLAGSGLSVFVVLSITGLTALFTSPQNHTYSFVDDNCFFNPVFLPNMVTQNKSDAFKTELRPKLSLGNTPIVSTSTCVQITSIPDIKTNDILTLESVANLQKAISVDIASLPSVKPYDSLKEPVSSSAVLLYSIDQPDNTFAYTLKINDITTDCVLHSSLLGCPLIDQNLAQGQTYTYEISRVLSSNSELALTESITTLAPVTVTDSTVKQDEVIYDYLKDIVLTTNKPVATIGKYSLRSGDGQDFPLTSVVQDNTATLTIAGDLLRNTNFTLTVESMTSDDGAYLSEPYVLNFKTSAGPQVQGINIGSYKVNPNSAITISFDIELELDQSIAQFVSLNNANGVIPASVSVQNNTVTINPDGSLGVCNSYSINVADGIKNKFGISGNSTWSSDFRTICQQAFSVGSSVQGRSITGYRFGSGSRYVVFVGGLHGNEQSSTLTLNSWVEELERNYQNIPSDKTIIVIPNTNPDGYAVDSRLNANGVDLNRNFPANNWQTGVYIPPNKYLETGGGANALSEPESSSLATYLLAVSPRLVLTFHATAGAVISNGAGDASAAAEVYGQKSGFTKYEQHDEDGIFSYTTTGEMEDWLRDKHSIPTLLVELRTQYSNEITRQKPALWAMLSL